MRRLSTASLAALGAAAGCLVAQSMMNAFGPRGTLLLSHVVCVIGWMLTATSLTTANFLAGRLLTGVFVGAASVSAAAYSAECFPHRRASRPVVYTALGVLCVYLARALLGYAQTAALATAATAASFVLIRAFAPESPAWLESRGRVGDAEYARLKLRLQVVTTPAAPRHDTVPAGPHFLRHASRPDVHRPFLALCLHLALLQLSGPLVLVAYAAELVGDSGVRVLNSYFIAVVLAGFLVAGSFVSVAMDHRESTAVLSSTGIMAAGVVVAAYNLARAVFLNRLGSRLLSFIPLFALMAFAMSSSVALVPDLPVDNTPGEHVAQAFSYVVAFSVIKCYPYVQAYLGWWVFAVFAVTAALNIVYGVLMFSDTKSKRPTVTPRRSSVGPAV